MLKNKKIVLDPGHGGTDPGAVDGINKTENDSIITRECDIAFDIVDRISKLLSPHSVILTRPKDKFESLTRRCEISNKSKADIFVSIHMNAVGVPTAKGYEVYSYRDSKAGARLRDIVLNELTQSFPNMRNRGGKEAGFFVLKHTNAPAILVECGFITNTEEEKEFNKVEVRQKMAEAIAKGIKKFLS